MEAEGSRVHWRPLDDQAYAAELRLKLLEEAQEVVEAQSRQELMAELADLLEVIDAIASLSHIFESELLQTKAAKYQERGGFAARRFLETVEHAPGSFGEQYCLQDPIKYPLIE